MDKNLEKLTALISQHRKSKKGAQYPATIWESVSGLRKQHTVVEISRRIVNRLPAPHFHIYKI